MSKRSLIAWITEGRDNPDGPLGEFARRVEAAEETWLKARNAPGLKRREQGGVGQRIAHLLRVLEAGDVPAEERAELEAGAKVGDGLQQLEQRAILACREHLLAFACYCYQGNRPYFQANWHHRTLAQLFERCARGEVRRVLVSTPPRHGKTELLRMMSAWLLGTDPDARIVAGAYSSRLAYKSSRAVRRVVASPEYREIFPDVRLPDRREILSGEYTLQAGEWELAGGFRGGYYASGLSGSVTGSGGGYILVDDPCKNRQEAESIVYQDSVFERFTDDWTSRKEAPDVQIVMATRWGDRDLIGQLLDRAKSDETADQWEVVNLPALLQSEEDRHPDDPRELGDPLWPEIYLRPEEWTHPPDRDALIERARADLIQQIAKTQGGEALFQGRPVHRDGGVFKAEWFRRFWTTLPSGPGEWVQSWDPKASSSKRPWASYTVGDVWFRPQGSPDCYLIDQERDRVGVDGAIVMLHRLTDKYPLAVLKIIERKGYGGTLLDLCKAPHAVGQQQFSGIAGLSDKVPRGDKVTRAEVIVPLASAGNIILPDPSVRPWVSDWIREVTRFSGKATDTADRVDTMSQALCRWTTVAKPFSYAVGGGRQSNGFR